MGFTFPDGSEPTEEGLKFQAFCNEIESLEISVGFNEKSGSYEDGITTAMVAAWNELGTERAPSRPFMRQTVSNNEDEIRKYAKKWLAQACTGKITTKEAMNKIGSYVKGRMQKQIRDGEFEPNAESTIARKHSDRPLIDTGHMRQSVIYEVESK